MMILQYSTVGIIDELRPLAQDELGMVLISGSIAT